MARRDGRANRCPNCRVNFRFCFCEDLKLLGNKTPLHVIMHFRERFLTSNTVHLATKTLGNCHVHLRGKEEYEIPTNLIKDDSTYTPLFLFPSEDSVVLTEDFVKGLKHPPKLIIPDGTWRQAKKIHKREGLEGIQAVRLPFTRRSRYQLRTANHEDQLCTYEAIADALGIIEGEALRESMLSIFEIMVDRNMKARAGDVVHKDIPLPNYQQNDPTKNIFL